MEELEKSKVEEYITLIESYLSGGINTDNFIEQCLDKYFTEDIYEHWLYWITCAIRAHLEEGNITDESLKHDVNIARNEIKNSISPHPVYCFQYRGYLGEASLCGEYYYGKVTNLVKDVVTFQSDTVEGLYDEFVASVVSYLEWCKENE